MTPFAIEISRNIGRFLSNKIHKSDLSSLQNLTNAMFGYLEQIYRFSNVSIYHNGDNSIYMFKRTDADYNEDVYVPCFFVVQGNENIQEGESIFWQKLHDLESYRSQYKNVDGGFVFFIAMQKELWDAQLDATEGDGIYSIKGTQSCHMTLYPECIKNGMNYKRCQMIWLPTKYSNCKYLLATHDDSYNVPGEYDCEIVREANAPNYSITDDFVQYEYQRPNIGEPNDVYEKFSLMLSKGRFINARKEILHWENDILNDYSRLIMSPALRRLKDKTQVFSLEESDFARVRLTHSLEVAHVARLLGNGIVGRLSEHIPNIIDLYIPDILMVAGLVHDIGNPPFGHFGERTIRKFYREDIKKMPEIYKYFEALTDQEQADFKYFDGNVQGFRILRHLGLASDCHSFNLNKVILSTLIKYPYSSTEGNKRDSPDHRKHKFGFFSAESEAYNNICQSLCLDAGQRHPLTYLLEAADDIIYMCDDIEDGWKLGYIPLYRIERAFSNVFSNEDIQAIFREEKNDILNQLENEDSVMVAHTIQNIRISMQRYMIDKCIENFVNEETFRRIVNNQLDGNMHEILLYDAVTRKIKLFWQELVQHCYNKIHRIQLQGGKAIESLLSIFLPVAFSNNLEKHIYADIDRAKTSPAFKRQFVELNKDDAVGMIYEIISDNYRKELSPLGHNTPQDAYSKFLLVTDYIAGMTDNFAVNLYNELRK